MPTAVLLAMALTLCRLILIELLSFNIIVIQTTVNKHYTSFISNTANRFSVY